MSADPLTPPPPPHHASDQGMCADLFPEVDFSQFTSVLADVGVQASPHSTPPREGAIWQALKTPITNKSGNLCANHQRWLNDDLTFMRESELVPVVQ